MEWEDQCTADLPVNTRFPLPWLESEPQNQDHRCCHAEANRVGQLLKDSRRHCLGTRCLNYEDETETKQTYKLSLPSVISQLRGQRDVFLGDRVAGVAENFVTVQNFEDNDGNSIVDHRPAGMQ